MLTFEEVRERVMPQLAREYDGPGSFYLAEWGWEDASEYALIVGAREAIIGQDPEYMVLDDQQVLADRRTGVLRLVSAMTEPEHTWRPVGNWSKAPTDEE